MLTFDPLDTFGTEDLVKLACRPAVAEQTEDLSVFSRFSRIFRRIPSGIFFGVR